MNVLALRMANLIVLVKLIDHIRILGIGLELACNGG